MPLGRLVLFLALSLLWVLPVSAQQKEKSFYPRYDYFGGLSFPKGLTVGGRFQPLEHFSFEGALGSYIVANSLTVGLNIHPSRSNAEFDPAYSLLGSYLKSTGEDWYILSGTVSFLTLHKSGLNSYYRVGVSAWVRPLENSKYRVLPLPYLEVGLSWSFPSLSY